MRENRNTQAEQITSKGEGPTKRKSDKKKSGQQNGSAQTTSKSMEKL